MSKRIGFRSYDKQDEEEEENLIEEKKKEVAAIADFIKRYYSPIGATSDKVYKTTAELRYELSNIIDVNPAILAKQLCTARFAVQYIAGQPFWVMFEK